MPLLQAHDPDALTRKAKRHPCNGIVLGGAHLNPPIIRTGGSQQLRRSVIVRGVQLKPMASLCVQRAQGPCQAICPWLMMPTWSLIWSISESRWLDTRTVQPRLAGRDRISSRIS